MSALDITGLVDALVESGTDSWNLEAKDARGGMPDTIGETLSAFANMPEGGTIVLGVCETPDGMEVTGVKDPAGLVDALAKKAREKIVPPVQLGAAEWESIDGAYVVACVVPPQASDLRPFRVGRYGPSYIRSGEGDHSLSEQEELYLVSQRSRPIHDLQPVDGASVAGDLVPELLDQYLESQRRESSRLHALERDELLRRTNVVDHETGLPTVAAVYAFDIHPQQFLPQTAVKAYAKPSAQQRTDVRLSDRVEFSGPIPDLLDSAMEWVSKHLMHGVRFDNDHGYNAPEIPPVAVREIVANALVHRDLSAASYGSYPMLVKEPDKLIVTNPGGLWGLTVREFGTTGPRARNEALYKMCSSITSWNGTRVIERHATGILEVRRRLREAFLPEPFFQDEVIRFQTIISSSAVLPQKDIEWLSSLPANNVLSVAQKHALVAMRRGEEITNSIYRDRYPMDKEEARAELQELVKFGLAHVIGGGHGTSYSLGPAGGRTEPEAQAPASRPAPPRSDTDVVIEAMKSFGGPRRRRDTAHAAGLTENHTYRVLRGLIDEGLVGTDKDPEDGRAFRYFLV